MIDFFFKNKSTYIIQSKFGNFTYDIDVSRQLPREAFFDKSLAREALLSLDDIFTQNKITFFLIFGTALGAIRENDFLEHDIDIDIGIFIKDKDKLTYAIDTLIKEKIFTILKISNSEESITLVYKNIIIDIGFFKLEKNYYIYNDFYENRFPRKFLDKLEKIILFDKEFFVPSPAHEYLVHQYGKNWQTPIQEWNYFNKYISKRKLELLQKIKKRVKNTIKDIIKDLLLKKEKTLFLNKLLDKLNIKDIKSISKSGQGFCDTYIIKANRNIVLKINNQKRFDYFRKSFSSVEPIYNFLEYSDRFKHEKKLFEKLNKREVEIKDSIIIFPFLESTTPLSSFLYKDEFYLYLKKAIDILKEKNIKHGDFHIENILVSDTNQVYLIDFEMTFSNYLSEKEQFYYDVYYFFAKLEYQYPKFFNEHFDKLKLFIKENFSPIEIETIVILANKTKKYFFTVNGARIELFE